MNAETFDRAVALATERQHVLMSTIDRSGVPHIVSVGSFEHLAEEKIALGDWHCPVTLRNLQYNPHVALVVWNIATDYGYQLIGQVQAVRPSEYPMMDDNEQELIVHVHEVLSFSHAGHADVEASQSVEPLTAEIDPPSSPGVAPNPNWGQYLYIGDIGESRADV